MFQGFNLLPRTSALENVELPMLYQGVPAASGTGARRRPLERVGLRGRESHTPAQLSGGQQQRVAIARALVNRPKLLLADEPTGNLDSRTSEEVLAIFQQLNADGITVLLVTHETDVADHAKRVVTFKDGLLLSDHPVAAPRVAATAGRAMNLLASLRTAVRAPSAATRSARCSRPSASSSPWPRWSRRSRSARARRRRSRARWRRSARTSS